MLKKSLLGLLAGILMVTASQKARAGSDLDLILTLDATIGASAFVYAAYNFAAATYNIFEPRDTTENAERRYKDFFHHAKHSFLGSLASISFMQPIIMHNYINNRIWEITSKR